MNRGEIALLFEYPLIILIYLVPVMLVSFTVHEVAHAYCSYKLGDPTAKNMGRLTLNPLKHLDILGTIMLLLFGFGWAKPVPINPLYYDDRKRGTMLVSIAGPLSNILMALVFSFPMAYFGFDFGIISAKELFSVENIIFAESFLPEIVVFNLSRFFYIININLAVFNILPVPPLDGSKILAGILPSNQYFKLLQYERYIGALFFILLFIYPNIIYKIMSPIIWLIELVIRSIAVPVVNLFI